MCGPAGSGKSTVARGLEAEGFVRLSIDEEAWDRGYRAQPLPASVAEAIERGLRTTLVGLVEAGSDVVVDFSFWSRRMRAAYRALLRPLGVTPEIVYLATPREVVLRRIRERRGDDPNAVRLPPDVAMAYADAFEPPTPDEGPLTVIRTE